MAEYLVAYFGVLTLAMLGLGALAWWIDRPNRPTEEHDT